MKKQLLLKKMKGSFFIAILMLLFSWQANAHVTEIRVNQNADGTLTWYLQTYHTVNSCGHSNAGLTINGVRYNISSEHSGSTVGLSPTVFAVVGRNRASLLNNRRSYAIVKTPYIAGNLNVSPYSNNVCWAFMVGGNGSFTPPPPPICTDFPVTAASNTLGTANGNGTDCDNSDDTIPVNMTVNHLICGNITGDGKFSAVLDPNGANIPLGNFDYTNGITKNFSFNLPAGVNAQVQFTDNDFPGQTFIYDVNGLGGTEFTGVADQTPPTVLTKNFILKLGTNGQAILASNDINNNSFDDCGIASMTLSTSSFDCSNIGENTVSLTVTDNNGNSASGSAIVTVVDEIAPTVETKNYTVTLVNGAANITASNIDNGTSDNCSTPTLSIDKNTFTCSDTGEHSITLTATDSSGNTSSKTATVTVIGTIPTVTISDFTAVQSQQANTIYLGYGPQSTNLSANAIGGNTFTYQWSASTGESLDAVSNPEINPKVSTTYTVTTTNNFGCSTTATIEVCVIDARSVNKKGKATGKVTICHHTNGKKGTKHVELNISTNAVMSHLSNHGVGTSHGDRLGGCEAMCISGDSTPTTITQNEGNELELTIGTVVYPNPSNGKFSIKLENITSETELLLFDLSGKLIEQKIVSPTSSSNISIDRRELSSGIYLLRIISNEKMTTKKIVIKK
jgi:hypothetical protein